RWRITDRSDTFVVEKGTSALNIFRETPPSLVTLAADKDQWAELYLASLTDAGLLRPEDEPPGIRSQPEFASFMSVITAGLRNDGGETSVNPRQEITSAGKLAGFFDQVRRWYGHDPNQLGS